MKKFLLLNLLLISSLNFSQTLLETIDLPGGTFYNYAYGMVYDSGKYWISSNSSSAGKHIIYAVNSSGTQIDVLNFSPAWIRESHNLNITIYE